MAHADSAGIPFDGREFHENPAAGDDGSADPRLLEAVRRFRARDLGVPEVPEFLQMLSDMGAQLWACKLSVDMMGLEQDDLFDEVVDVINVSEFMELSAGAQIIFV